MEALVDTLVREKAERLGPSQRLAWSQAVTRAATAGLEESLLRELVRACASARDLSRVADLLGRVSEGGAVLAQAAEDAEGGMAAVAPALIVLLNYLEERGRTTELSVALGYLGCCDEGAGRDGIRATLPEAVQSHLSDYGFDG